MKSVEARGLLLEARDTLLLDSGRFLSVHELGESRRRDELFCYVLVLKEIEQRLQLFLQVVGIAILEGDMVPVLGAGDCGLALSSADVVDVVAAALHDIWEAHHLASYSWEFEVVGFLQRGKDLTNCERRIRGSVVWSKSNKRWVTT